ncbi:MAG: CHAT domain-containing protein [Saprospiraceae bacterium]|nr:CHAT domain-containing protein [Saprospiraceae bacterium]
MGILFSMTLKSQYTPANFDALCALRDSGAWLAYVSKLNKIWKGIPDSVFDDRMHKEALHSLFWMEQSKAPDSLMRRAHMYLGNRFRNLNKWEQALQTFLKAHAYVSDKFCLDRWCWYVENELGNIYNRKDELDESLYFHQLTAEALEHQNFFDSLTRNYTNIARLYASKGDLSRSKQYALKGFNLAKKINHGQGMFANAMELASNYLDEDSLGMANHFIREGQKIFKQTTLDKEKENHFMLCTVLAKYNHKIKFWKLSEKYFEEAQNYFIEDKDRDYIKCNISWARMYLDQGNLEQCKRRLVEAMNYYWPEVTSLEFRQLPDTTLDDNTYSELFEISSSYFTKLHQLEPCEAWLEQSIRYCYWSIFGYGQIRNELLSDNSKLTIISYNRKLVDRAIAQLAEWKKTGGDRQTIMEYARLFLDASKGLLQQEKAQRACAFEKLTDVRRKNFRAWQEYEIRLKLNRRNPGYEEGFVFNELVKCNRVKQHYLGSRSNCEIQIVQPEHYLEYHTDRNKVYVFASLNGSLYFESLGPYATLDSLLRQWFSCCREPNNTEYQTVLRELFLYLMPKEVRSIPKNIKIIADAEIQLIPFDALLQPAGRYLMEDCILDYAFSYREAVLPKKKTANDAIYVIHPQYPIPPDPAHLVENLLASRGNAYALSYTQEEVSGLQQLYRNGVIVDTSSDINTLLNGMRKATKIHYSGHAKAEGPEAYLVLPGANNRLELELLSGYYQPWDMVVLSACETGLGEWEYGEGLRSLGKTFREAGAASVIMSLWAVNDKSTAAVMIRFYQNLKAGLSISAALNEAKVHYWKQAGFEKKHPYYWAGFVGYGEDYY